MICKNLKALAGTVRRQHASLETATRRRKTIYAAANAPTSAHASRDSGTKRANQHHSETKRDAPHQALARNWTEAANELSHKLSGTALRVRAMPPDGNCFYHAVADRLKGLGHAYTFHQLKDIAGASHGEEAEEHHIRKIAEQPVPLYIKFVPVDIAAEELSRN